MTRLARVTALLIALLLAGCTYSREEPGLFPRSALTPPAPKQRLPPQPTNPALPVLAERVWTTGEGLQVTTRFALHAVRRIPGATILDWSVTPLAAPGYQPGDDLPAWVDLGLTREAEGDVKIVLVDHSAGKAYRPISDRRRKLFERCLCSPLWAAQLSLRIGETRVLQVAFPELPAGLAFVDVDLINSLPIWHVPVLPIGQVPVATHPTDLARPADVTRPLSAMQVFGDGHGQGRRLQGITIDAVERSPEFTSIRWTLLSVTDQPSFLILPYGPPVSARIPDEVGVFSPGSASGPQIRAAGGRQLLKARWMTMRAQQNGYFECLCTDLSEWASSLRQAGSAVDVVTNFPSVPAGVRTVDVILPGVATIRDLPVTPASDVAAQVPTTQPGSTRVWVYHNGLPRNGWSTIEWPTPLPDNRQLADYASYVEDLVNPPGW